MLPINRYEEQDYHFFLSCRTVQDGFIYANVAGIVCIKYFTRWLRFQSIEKCVLPIKKYNRFQYYLYIKAGSGKGSFHLVKPGRLYLRKRCRNRIYN